MCTYINEHITDVAVHGRYIQTPPTHYTDLVEEIVGVVVVVVRVRVGEGIRVRVGGEVSVSGEGCGGVSVIVVMVEGIGGTKEVAEIEIVGTISRNKKKERKEEM